MGSPFPGMDPYIESSAHWQDFHARFINDLSDVISEVLPDDYFARIEEHVMMVTPDSTATTTARPDVSVFHEKARATRRGSAALAEVDIAPATLTNIEYLDPHTESFLEILHLPSHQVVTVVELLSPTNKMGEGRGLYLEKRHQFLRRPVNVVELDLIRRGKRLDLDGTIPPGHYHIFISRSDRRPNCDVYSWPIQRPLPMLPVPLRPGEAEVKADVGKAFAATYDRGRYMRLIDYSKPAPPPIFDGADGDWVAGITAKVLR